MPLTRRPLSPRPRTVSAGVGARRPDSRFQSRGLRYSRACFRCSRHAHGEVTARRRSPEGPRPSRRICDPAAFRTSLRPAADAPCDRGHPERSRIGNVAPFGLRHGNRSMKKPFAITLDPGSSLANHTGSWRTMRPVYVDRLPPCNDACPAGEDIQGWLSHAESGDYRARVAGAGEEQSAARGDGTRLLSPVRERRAIAAAARRGGRHPLGRALPRRRGAHARLAVRSAGDADGQARARRRRRPLGALGRLPSRAARPRRDDPRGGTVRRRHDALRHSQVPPAARRARRRRSTRIARSRRDLELEYEGRRHRASDAAAASTPPSSRSARTSRKRAYIPGRQLARDPRRGRRAALDGRRGEAAARAARRGLWRRQHRARRRAHRASASAPTRRSSSTGARARRCRRTTSSSRKRCRKASW